MSWSRSLRPRTTWSKSAASWPVIGEAGEARTGGPGAGRRAPAPLLRRPNPAGPEPEPACRPAAAALLPLAAQAGLIVDAGPRRVGHRRHRHQLAREVGDAVAVDEPLLEVSTDKVDTEIPSPVAGTLLRSPPHRRRRRGRRHLAIIGSGSPAAAPPLHRHPPSTRARARARNQSQPLGSAARTGSGSPPAPAPAPTPAPPATAPAAESGDSGPYVTPLVRKLAAENNVDLSTVTGTGVGGRIRKQDVLAAAAPSAPRPPPQRPPPRSSRAGRPARTTAKANRIRQITAAKTLESLQTTAQLTQVHEADLTKVAACAPPRRRRSRQPKG